MTPEQIRHLTSEELDELQARILAWEYLPRTPEEKSSMYEGIVAMGYSLGIIDGRLISLLDEML
jgi:hypothetical protein